MLANIRWVCQSLDVCWGTYGGCVNLLMCVGNIWWVCQSVDVSIQVVGWCLASSPFNYVLFELLKFAVN